MGQGVRGSIIGFVPLVVRAAAPRRIAQSDWWAFGRWGTILVLDPHDAPEVARPGSKGLVPRQRGGVPESESLHGVAACPLLRRWGSTDKRHCFEYIPVTSSP